MYEYAFNFKNFQGQNVEIKFNDIFFDYKNYRRFLPEKVCLDVISRIKEQSKKQIAIIYGNCQTGKLQDFLLRNKIFAESYFVIKLPMVCQYEDDKTLGYFQENFWSLCDLLISQRISIDNRFNSILATQKLPLILAENVKIIWIPNVYFDGYFPQYVKNSHNIGKEISQSGLFPFGDKYIDAFLDGGA